MGAKAAVSLAEYLRTSYGNPDREYRDGEVVERSMPTWDHARLQKRLAAIFDRLEERLPLYAASKARLRISDTHVVIPDICVYAGTPPAGPQPSTPPFIAIEILSPDDRMKDVRTKLSNYHAWGVEHVWLADPETRDLFQFSSDGLHQVPVWRIERFDLELTAADLFR